MKSILLASVVGLLCLQSSFCMNKDKHEIQIDQNTGESLNKDRSKKVTKEFCDSVFNFYLLKKSLPYDLADAMKENMSNAQNTIIELYDCIDNTCFFNCYGCFLEKCELLKGEKSNDGQKIIANRLKLKSIDNLSVQLKNFGQFGLLTPKFIDKVEQANAKLTPLIASTVDSLINNPKLFRNAEEADDVLRKINALCGTNLQRARVFNLIENSNGELNPITIFDEVTEKKLQNDKTRYINYKTEYENLPKETFKQLRKIKDKVDRDNYLKNQKEKMVFYKNNLNRIGKNIRELETKKKFSDDWRRIEKNLNSSLIFRKLKNHTKEVKYLMGKSSCFDVTWNSIFLEPKNKHLFYTLFDFRGINNTKSGRKTFSNSILFSDEDTEKMRMFLHETGHAATNIGEKSLEIFSETGGYNYDKATMQLAGNIFTDEARIEVDESLKNRISRMAKQHPEVPGFKECLDLLSNISATSKECIARLLFNTSSEVLQILGFVVHDGILYINPCSDLAVSIENNWVIRMDHQGVKIDSDAIKADRLKINNDQSFLKIVKEKEVISLGFLFHIGAIKLTNLKLNRGFMNLLFQLNGANLDSYEEIINKKIEASRKKKIEAYPENRKKRIMKKREEREERKKLLDQKLLDQKLLDQKRQLDMLFK